MNRMRINSRSEPIFHTPNRFDCVKMKLIRWIGLHTLQYSFVFGVHRSDIPIIYYNLKHEQLRSTSRRWRHSHMFNAITDFAWQFFLLPYSSQFSRFKHERKGKTHILFFCWFFSFVQCVCLFFLQSSFQFHSTIFFFFISCVKFKHVIVLHGMLVFK